MKVGMRAWKGVIIFFILHHLVLLKIIQKIILLNQLLKALKEH